MGWDVGAVVASLRESKRLGIQFEDAWVRATAANPPWASDKRVTVDPEGDQLVLREGGQDSEVEESHYESVRRYCRDAWHGYRPALAHFSLDMMGSADYTRTAKIGRRNHARAAA
jgi:hypothetical protein